MIKPASFVLFMFILAAPTQSTPLDGKYCRFFEGMSRCVRPPLMVDDEDLWCPYEPCAPGYIPAQECPAGDEQATHKCKVEILDGPTYRCIEGKIHKKIGIPLGCGEEEGKEPCEDYKRTCTCEQIAPNHRVLKAVASITPICEV